MTACPFLGRILRALFGSCVCLVSLAICLAPALAQAGPVEIQPGSWTLAILPDTQHYSRAYPDVMNAQTQFLADNQGALNLAFVLQEGDVTDNNSPDQWANASSAFAILDDAGVNYALAQGNHDIGPDGKSANRSSLLSTYFPVSRLAQQSTFGGVYPGVGGSEANLSDNNYSLFSAGGVDYLALSLEFGPRHAVVDWADSIMKAYPDRQAMIVTHAYLYNDSTRYDWKKKGKSQSWNPHAYAIKNVPGGVNDGEEMWQKLKDNENLQFVFNGHVLGDGTGYLRSVGDNGNPVQQILANYQFLENGGQGYMRLLEFLPDGDTVHVRTYSPWLDAQGEDPYRVEGDQDFVISLSSILPRPEFTDRAVGANLQVDGLTAPSANTAGAIQIQSGAPTIGTLQVNRGDYQISVGGTGVAYDQGIMLASVAQNVRDGVRATVEVGHSPFGDNVLSLATQSAGYGSKEVNVNTSTAWFDFRAGWQGAHFDAKGNLMSSNDINQQMLTRQNTGRYTLDLGVDSRNDGLLLAIGGNNSNMIVNTGVLADGTGWDIRVQNNRASFSAKGKDADFSILYLPLDTDNLIGGRYDGAADQHLIEAGNFDMTRLDNGQYSLNIPGETPDTGMLILTTALETTAGKVTAPDDNFLTYEGDGGGNFLINSYDLTGTTKFGTAGRGIEFQDTSFVWAFIDFDDPIAMSSSNAASLFSSASSPPPLGTFNAVPEPTSITLALVGFVGLYVAARMRPGPPALRASHVPPPFQGGAGEGPCLLVLVGEACGELSRAGWGEGHCL